MEEEGNENDLLGNVVKPPALRVSGSLKSTLSGRLTPRSGSPLASFRRSQSIRTPRKDVLKDVKWHTRALLWIRGRSLFTWLMIIVIWSYFGFHLQSTWIIGEDSDEKEFNNGHSNGIHAADHIRFDTLKGVTMNTTAQFQESFNGSVNIEIRNSRNKTTNLVSRSNRRGTVKENLKKWLGKGKRWLKRANATNSLAHQNHSSNRNSSHHTVHNSIHGSKDKKQIFSTAENSSDSNGHTNEILKTDTTLRKNSSYGLLVGPFDITEEQILGWHAGKRYGTCNRKGSFAHIVNGRLFTLIFHELSMTGAPLAMLELGAEILSCGGQVSAVALSKKGGLMREITKRGIKLLKDRTVPSFKVAMKSELVIAGSAVSASWIGKYLSFNKRGGDRLVWWIMENRYEYFNRSKHMLQNAKALLFLSDIQSQQWKKWCVEEGIRMPKTVEILPLSVNDELAFVAGIPTSLNTPTFSVEKMVEKKNNLRNEVRRIMGVTSNDMLLMTLSSINPGKGQLKLLKSVLMLINETFDPYSDGLRSVKSVIDSVGRTDIRRRGKRKLSSISEPLNVLHEESVSANGSNHSSGLGYITNKHANRKLSSVVANSHPNLKLLIGSIGSKSNKVPYVNSILNLVSRYPDLVNILLWTPSTVHVAPLYAAADVYVINAQGAGETFGRVTIEAMAFGLPVLGTDAGGTKEIVDHNVTGLLHPVGELGMNTLSQNIRFLLKNEPARKHMGQNGKEKVEKLFLKHHMYNKFAAILNKAMAYT